MSNQGYTTESDDEETMAELREMRERELAAEAQAKAVVASAAAADTAKAAKARAKERTVIKAKIFISDKKIHETRIRWEEARTTAEANPGDKKLDKRSNTARIQHELAKRTYEYYLGKLADFL